MPAHPVINKDRRAGGKTQPMDAELNILIILVFPEPFRLVERPHRSSRLSAEKGA
jgi:hypothetical protein